MIGKINNPILDVSWDFNSHKGIYHINAVDEVTHWEIISSVERISETYLVPVLETMLLQVPFVIRGFHSANGSEFVNHIVARLRLLNKLLIRFTKSRPMHSDDNGLVETRNGSAAAQKPGICLYPAIMQSFHHILTALLHHCRPGK